MKPQPSVTEHGLPLPASFDRFARVARGATVAVVAVEGVLLATGRIALGTAVAVVLVVEAVLGSVILTAAWRAARQHPGDRLPAAARAILPGPVAAVALFELRQLRALWLLAHRRTDTHHADDRTIPYAAGRGGIYLMLGAASLIELVVVHLIVPWHRLGSWSWLQWLAFGLTAYGVVWLLAWWAAQRTHPHLISSGELVLRNGTLVTLRVPLDRIRAITPRRRGLDDENRLMLGGPGGGTNLDVDLVAPVTWRSVTGRRARQVSAVSLEVDDSALAARLLGEAVPR